MGEADVVLVVQHVDVCAALCVVNGAHCMFRDGHDVRVHNMPDVGIGDVVEAEPHPAKNTYDT